MKGYRGKNKIKIPNKTLLDDKELLYYRGIENRDLAGPSSFVTPEPTVSGVVVFVGILSLATIVAMALWIFLK